MADDNNGSGLALRVASVEQTQLELGGSQEALAQRQDRMSAATQLLETKQKKLWDDIADLIAEDRELKESLRILTKSFGEQLNTMCDRMLHMAQSIDKLQQTITKKKGVRK